MDQYSNFDVNIRLLRDPGTKSLAKISMDTTTRYIIPLILSNK